MLVMSSLNRQDCFVSGSSAIHYLFKMSKSLKPLFLFFSFLFFASGSPLYGQKLFYEIYKGEDRIGEITVEKKAEGNTVHYEANSEANFRVLFKNRLITHTSSRFVDKELVYARSEITLNDKVRESGTTKKEGNYYNFFKHPDTNVKRKEAPFLISTTVLYYFEPSGVEEVFSENYQQLCKLKNIGAHAYELALPGGKINQYFYKNGKLVEVKIIRTFVDLSFKLKENS